jgi:YhcN/YlaJ family sporulation lipoprotein
MFARKTVFIALALTIAALMTGCMSAGDEPMNTRMPVNQNQTAVTAEPTNAMGTAFDWTTGAQDVENSIIQLSEVKDARVVIAGNTALVGVKFDDAYKGEMTERIREMIAGVVKKADASIQTVAVTNETDDVTGIYDISDKVRGGQRFEEFKDDINSIVRNITTIR